MKYRHLVFILPYFLFYQSGHADSIISLFIRPYPQPSIVAEKIKKPGKIARHTVEGLANYQVPSGIFASYAGYLTISDFDGQIIFPRKHEQSKIQVIITPEIKPILMLEKTIHHWELIPGVPAKMYTFEQKFNEETNLDYWDVQSAMLPENNIIPLSSLIIFAKPRYFFVPLGITTTNDTPNLVLPPIYAKKGIKITKNALYVFNLSHFFGNVLYLYKKFPKRYDILFYD
jgi:hypothetical protein